MRAKPSNSEFRVLEKSFKNFLKIYEPYGNPYDPNVLTGGSIISGYFRDIQDNEVSNWDMIGYNTNSPENTFVAISSSDDDVVVNDSLIFRIPDKCNFRTMDAQNIYCALYNILTIFPINGKVATDISVITLPVGYTPVCKVNNDLFLMPVQSKCTLPANLLKYNLTINSVIDTGVVVPEDCHVSDNTLNNTIASKFFGMYKYMNSQVIVDGNDVYFGTRVVIQTSTLMQHMQICHLNLLSNIVTNLTLAGNHILSNYKFSKVLQKGRYVIGIGYTEAILPAANPSANYPVLTVIDTIESKVLFNGPVYFSGGYSSVLYKKIAESGVAVHEVNSNGVYLSIANSTAILDFKKQIGYETGNFKNTLYIHLSYNGDIYNFFNAKIWKRRSSRVLQTDIKASDMIQISSAEKHVVISVSARNINTKVDSFVFGYNKKDMYKDSLEKGDILYCESPGSLSTLKAPPSESHVLGMQQGIPNWKIPEVIKSTKNLNDLIAFDAINTDDKIIQANDKRYVFYKPLKDMKKLLDVIITYADNKTESAFSKTTDIQRVRLMIVSGAVDPSTFNIRYINNFHKNNIETMLRINEYTILYIRYNTNIYELYSWNPKTNTHVLLTTFTMNTDPTTSVLSMLKGFNINSIVISNNQTDHIVYNLDTNTITRIATSAQVVPILLKDTFLILMEPSRKYYQYDILNPSNPPIERTYGDYITVTNSIISLQQTGNQSMVRDNNVFLRGMTGMVPDETLAVYMTKTLNSAVVTKYALCKDVVVSVYFNTLMTTASGLTSQSITISINSLKNSTYYSDHINLVLNSSEYDIFEGLDTSMNPREFQIFEGDDNELVIVLPNGKVLTIQLDIPIYSFYDIDTDFSKIDLSSIKNPHLRVGVTNVASVDINELEIKYI